MNTLNVDTISNITSYLNYYDVVHNEVLYISKAFYKSCKLIKMKEFKVIYDIYNMLKNDLLYIITTRREQSDNYPVSTFIETLINWEKYKIFQYITNLTVDKPVFNWQLNKKLFSNVGTKITKMLSEIENRKRNRKRKTITRTNRCHKVAKELHILSW